MREIRKIIIHCSASGDVSADEIRQWHLARNWRDIGYHYVIRASGAIEQGRPLEESGAHCKGQNADSVGVCLTGGKDGAYDFTPEQFKSLESLVSVLTKTLEIEDDAVKGHNDFTTEKTCPNFDVWEWWQGVTF